MLGPALSLVKILYESLEINGFSDFVLFLCRTEMTGGKDMSVLILINLYTLKNLW